MPQKLAIVATTAALVTQLRQALPSVYAQEVDVEEAGGGDFDNSGQLVLKKIAVRVRFGQSEYSGARDISRTNKAATLRYQIVCRHESLRGGAEMRSRTLDLVDCVQQQLGGAKLTLQDGTVTEPIDILGVSPVSDSYGPVDNCYGVTIDVTGYIQFSGGAA